MAGAFGVIRRLDQMSIRLQYLYNLIQRGLWLDPTTNRIRVGAESCNISQLMSGTWSTLTPPVSSSNRVAGVSLAAAVLNADATSSARTSSGNSGTISTDFGAAIAAVINLTANSGTGQTLDMILQESWDNGTTWNDVYHCERLTTVNTTIVVPLITIGGRRRWVWNIAGTTPSFTFTINTHQSSLGNPPIRQFYDRTANLLNGTASASGSAFLIQGCKAILLSFTCGAITTTAGQYMLQFSADGTNWWDGLSGNLTAVASSTVAAVAVANQNSKWCRVLNKVAGSGQTGTFFYISGVN